MMTQTEFETLKRNRDVIQDGAYDVEAARKESARICFQVEPPRTRRVFMLFFVEGKSWRQIADEMGYTDGSTARKMKIEWVKRNVS